MWNMPGVKGEEHCRPKDRGKFGKPAEVGWWSRPVTTQSSPMVRPDSGCGDRAGLRESGERQLAGKIQLWVIFYFLSWKEAIWGFVCCQFVF